MTFVITGVFVAFCSKLRDSTADNFLSIKPAH